MGELRVAARAGGHAVAGESSLEAFRGGLRGPLLLAGDAGYDEARTVFNALIDLTVRVTGVYRKINGGWLIVHEHVSVPVDVAS